MPRAPKLCGVIDAAGSCGLTQPCPTHPKIPWQGSTRRTELPANWARLRAKVLARDVICTLGTRCAFMALSVEVHHGERGKHDHSLENLHGTCVACHRDATSKQATEARRHQA